MGIIHRLYVGLQCLLDYLGEARLLFLDIEEARGAILSPLGTPLV